MWGIIMVCLFLLYPWEILVNACVKGTLLEDSKSNKLSKQRACMTANTQTQIHMEKDKTQAPATGGHIEVCLLCSSLNKSM